MISFTTEELTQRFLQITKKLAAVGKEKNWLMFNHFLTERNDIIEFLETRKSELTEEDYKALQEAWEIQVSSMKEMEGYQAEIQALQVQARKVQQAGRRYQEQAYVGRIIHHK